MVDQNNLQKYVEKYEKVKENVEDSFVMKKELEKQYMNSKMKLKSLSNDISDEKTNMWFELRKKLVIKKNILKKQLNAKIVADLLAIAFLISLGYIVYGVPLIVINIALSLIPLIKIFDNIRNYKKEKKSCYLDKIKVNDLKNDKINELNKEFNRELKRKQEIKEILDLVNQRLEELAGVKLDIENIIICLFSSLDSNIKSRNNEQEPFATWLNVYFEEKEPKIEMTDSLKRTLNKAK